MEIQQGKNLILLMRPLKRRTEEAAWKLVFQTEYSFKKSKSTDSTTTKDGTAVSVGEAEYELSSTSLVAVGDTQVDVLSNAFDDDDVMEIWLITSNVPGTGADVGKFKAEYAQAYISDFEQSAKAEDNVELSLDFAIYGKVQKGFATLTEDQAKIVQYVFEDTTKAVEED